MRMKAPKQDSCDTNAPLKLPHSLHRAFPSDQENIVCHCLLCASSLSFTLILSAIFFNIFQEGYQTFRGAFWNYFSLGKNFAPWPLKTAHLVPLNSIAVRFYLLDYVIFQMLDIYRNDI